MRRVENTRFYRETGGAFSPKRIPRRENRHREMILSSDGISIKKEVHHTNTYDRGRWKGKRKV